MNPNSIRRPRFDHGPIANERMTTICNRIDHSVDHPPIQSHLGHVVYQHGLGQEQFHVVFGSKESLGDEAEGWQRYEIENGEEKGHLVGMHGGSQAWCGVARRVSKIGPKREEADHDGRGCIPCEHRGCFV